MSEQQATGFKPKKSVALSGVTAGNTALCTVGKTGNDLHYRGYDILDIAQSCEFEEIAHLLVHGKLPTSDELRAYKNKLLALRGLPLPGWPVRVGLLGITLAATFMTHSTLLGRDAGVTLIVVLLALKTLEMRARRAFHLASILAASARLWGTLMVGSCFSCGMSSWSDDTS